jgi:hypothetical protein
MSQLTDKKDLTRWNRSGLSRFRYLDGNAISFLETLRQAMGEAFTEGGINQWSALDRTHPVGVDETPAQRQARWKAQYYDERRDYAWEILRSYARASHVLTEHLDAYANESYLNTASQWDNLRRLVEMLDYHPAPPASATTPLALLAKAGKSGTVAVGFACKDKPEDGSPPSVFETLDDLDIDHALNQLKALDWNKSQQTFDYDSATDTASFPLSQPVEGVSVGTPGVLLVESGGNETGVAVVVTGIDDELVELLVETPVVVLPADIKLHQVRLLLKPDFKQSPQLSGSNVMSVSGDHGLSVDSVVAWQVGSTWNAARVEQVEVNRILLSSAAPADGTEIYLTAYSEAQDLTVGGIDVNRVILPTLDHREQWALFDSNLNRINYYSTIYESGEALYTFLSGSSFEIVYYLPKDGDSAVPVATVEESNPQGVFLDGDPGKLATGDWLVAQVDGEYHAAVIDAIEEGEDSYALELGRTFLDEIELLLGDFELELRPLDYQVNETPVFATEPALRSNSHSLIYLEGEEIPALLDVGRVLIIAGRRKAMEVTVKAIDDEFNAIKVSPAIPGSELTAEGTTDNYTRYHTVIYGNVVDAGHGETQKQSILGSGDATQSNQTFDFDAEQVSFVDDGKFPPGVRAAVDVSVDGRIWQQVASLNDSDAEDAHYTVRIKENGTLRLEFGDGYRGRRLPSGNNNLRILYRKGNGLSGKLPAYSLVKEVKPHSLVEQLVQPIDTTGGNDMETVESMRNNAPPSLLTLERAVSLADFTHLAAGNSSVWQARAFRRNAGVSRTELIEVAVVPAGGGELGSLKQTLESYLAGNALPGIRVEVAPYVGIILDLKLTLRIKQGEFNRELVAKTVEETLYEAFSLEKTKLGVPLYRSQVIGVVEGVSGVANCVCEINPYGFHDESGAEVTPKRITLGKGDVIKRVTLEDDQVIYMKAGLSALEIVTQTFTL